MRSKPQKTIDPDKFLRAFNAIGCGDVPVPDNDGVDIVLSDGSIQNVKVGDSSYGRAVYSLMQALPDEDPLELNAILIRIQALGAVARHPALAEFVKPRTEAMSMLHNRLIRAAAVCPLQRAFIPSQLLRTIRSISAPTQME
jgi:hypothetical protein